MTTGKEVYMTALFPSADITLAIHMGFSGGSDGKESAMQETQVQSLGQEVPWRREWLPIPVFLPGEFHGQRSLAGYSPVNHKESDMTEQLSYSHIFLGVQ